MVTTERALTPAEHAGLAARIARARTDSRTVLARTGLVCVIICGVLALLTVAASDAPWWVIVGFWSALTGVFTLWIGLPWHRTMRDQVVWLEDALRTNRARESRITSPRVIEFEEEEDEGACYAFEHGPDASIFIVGQEFYEDDDFPNSDFSLVELLGSHGGPIDWAIAKRGAKLLPMRIVGAATKRMMEIPEHLTVIGAPLEGIEDALTHAR